MGNALHGTGRSAEWDVFIICMDLVLAFFSKRNLGIKKERLLIDSQSTISLPDSTYIRRTIQIDPLLVQQHCDRRGQTSRKKKRVPR